MQQLFFAVYPICCKGLKTMRIQFIQWIIWSLCLAVAVWSDCKTRKIPNYLILAGVIFATVLAALQGSTAFWNAVAGGSAAFVVGVLFWKIKLFRAGDAKLLWMTMQFAGWSHWGMHIASILIAGGICALFVMVRHGILGQRMWRLSGYLGGLLMTQRYTPYQPVVDDPVQFPFAVAVFLGEVSVWIIWASRMMG